MKWHTHRLIGVSVAAFSGAGAVGALLSYIGSTLPDLVEGRPPSESGWFFRSKMRNWRKSHRGASHWFGWYVALALIAYHYHPVLAWIGIGAITHLAADALTPMGVPALPFSKKHMMSLSLFSTGSAGEYVFFLCLLTSLLYFISHHSLQVL